MIKLMLTCKQGLLVSCWGQGGGIGQKGVDLFFDNVSTYVSAVTFMLIAVCRQWIPG